MKDWDGAAYYIEKAIVIDDREDNQIGLAQDYNQMSKIYIDSESDKGLEYVEKTEQLYRQHGMSDTLQMAGTLYNKITLCQCYGFELQWPSDCGKINSGKR